MAVFVPVPYCFDYRGFVVEFEIIECDTSSSVFFLEITFSNQGPLYFHTNFRITCFSSVKNVFGNLIGIA